MKTSNKFPLGLLLLNFLALMVLVGIARPTQHAAFEAQPEHTEVKAVRVPFFSVIHIQGRAYLSKKLENVQNTR